MTNTKSTKCALLSSVLALFLCFAMLLGSTFAWFTDSVTSANNIIKSGNLDIELEYWNGTAWKDVKGASDILTGDLWEPGYVDVAYLRLKNAGSLALKYQLGVNIVSEKEGVNKEGQPFKLSDYIYFDVVEGVNGETNAYADRDAAMAKATETTKISAGYSKADNLAAGSDYVYLAMIVYMPTNVGNVANHNGTDIPEIDLGINIIATQMMAENDSFGPDYDENAGLYSVVVSSEDELVAALADAKNGDIIGISGNVNWTTGAMGGSTPFATDATYVTLQGVDENATFTAIGNGVGPVGIDNGTVIFKNLKIVDDSVSYAENNWEYGYLEFRGNTVFENCDIVNAIMMEGDSATFKNCSFTSSVESEYAVWVDNGDATFENCHFTGTRGIKVHEAYGSEVGTVIINNNTFASLSKKPGLAIGTVNEATTIKLTNNVFADTAEGNGEAAGVAHIYETDTAVNTFNFVYENNTTTDPVKTANELATALTGNNKSITVVLANDIELPIDFLGAATNGTGEHKLGGDNTEAITIDLNGHKLNVITTYKSTLGAKNDDAVITIKNGSMTSSLASGTWNEYDLSFANCNYVIENVTFDKAIAFVNAGKSAKLTNVTINETNDYYALWISAEGQTVIIDGLTVNSGRGIKIDEQYVNAADLAKVTLNVSNATFNTVNKAAIVVKSAAGADITLDNVNIANTVDPVNAVWVDEDAAASYNLVTVTGGTKFLEGSTVVSNADELFEAIEDNGNVALKDNINYNNTDPAKQMILESDSTINFDGNGKTITTEGADPSIGNHGYVGFVPTGDDKSATVSNLTVTGTGFVELGDYTVQGGNYTANNLAVKNLKSTLANDDKGFTLACGFAQYGTGTLNNCTMTGTIAMIDSAMAVDAGFVNNTTTVVNGGEYGVAYCWSHAVVTFDGAEVYTLYVAPIRGTVTVKAGTHIGTLNVDYNTSADYATGANLAKLVIEEGATVDAIVFNGTTYTVAEWNTYVASFNA